MNQLNKISVLLSITLPSKAIAYIPDRCDWMDCEAMANGTDEGGSLVFLIVAVIGVIIFLANSK